MYCYIHLLRDEGDFKACSMYFLQLMENETFKFEEQICDFEEDLASSPIPEDVRDAIHAAIGKAKLLMAQKLAQFRGLCDKNIVSHENLIPELNPN